MASSKGIEKVELAQARRRSSQKAAARRESILRLHRLGLNVAGIARQLRSNRQTVMEVLRAAGVEPRIGKDIAE